MNVKHEREHKRVVGGLRGLDQAVRGGPRLLTATGHRQCEHEACIGDSVGVTTACQLGAAPLDIAFGLADDRVRSAKLGLAAERHLFVAATADHQLAGVGVANSRLDSSGHPAPCCRHVQDRESGMVDGPGGLDELLAPGDRLIIHEQNAEERRVRGDGGGDVDVTLVGGPPKRGAQIGQLESEPVIRLTLAGAVPQGQDVG